MSARLASLLVGEGLLGQDVVTAALGRQVIYGGALDTALLEMKAIDEPRLWDALARATGLPQPPPELVESPRPEGASLFDLGMADRCHAVPVAMEGRRITLLCSEPVAELALTDVERDLGAELLLFVAPEVRVLAAREAIYARTMSPRYLALLGRILGAEPVRKWHGAGAGAPVASTLESPPNPRLVAETLPSDPFAADSTPLGPVPSSQASPPTPGSMSPTTDDVILHRLAGAQTRDEIFDALADAASSRMAFVVVFSVGGTPEMRIAQGRVARAGAKKDTDRIAGVTVSLAAPSPFRTVVESTLPYIGSPGGSDAVRGFLETIRRPGIPEIVLVPVVLRGRVVSLLYADRAGAFALRDDTGELALFATIAAKALELLILRSKADEYARAQPGTTAVVPRLEPVQAPPPPSALEAGAGAWSRPAAPAAGAGRVPDIEGHEIQAEPLEKQRSDLDALLDAYEADPEGPIGSAAGSAILRRGDVSAVLGRLSQRLHQGKSTATFENAMLRLCVMFGDAALPLVRPLLEHPHPGWRRRAAEMLVTLTAEGSEETLCRLAVDGDLTVRQSALRALRRRASHPQVQALAERLRSQLEGASPNAAAAAASALGELRDVTAVPLLIERLKGASPPVIIAAHRALRDICKQDYGDSRWRWGSWWKRWRDRERMEWLLEGLAHRSAEIRLSASEELRHLTGEYFGYHFDLPKRERDEARRRWVEWWQGTGRAPGGPSGTTQQA